MPKNTPALRLAALALCGAFAFGCGANYKSIYRTVELIPGKGLSLITDAKQRVITNIDIVNDSVSGQVTPKRIVCAEPSPDVASGISKAITAGLDATKGGAKVSASLGVSLAKSVVQLSERLAAIQLVREQMYRTCEAYAKGALSSVSYTILYSRLNKTMVTLLSSEMIAGVFGRALAKISGTAGTTSGESAEVVKAKKDLMKAVGDYKTLHKVYMGDNSNTNRDNLITAATKVQKKAEDLAKAQFGASSTFASGTANGDLGKIPGQIRPANVSGDLTRIHRQFMEASSFDTLMDACITSLDFARFSVKNNETDDQHHVGSDQIQAALSSLGDSPFNQICRYQILPEAAAIARSESNGKLGLQEIRAQTERLQVLSELAKFCSGEEAKKTTFCKKLPDLIQVNKSGSGGMASAMIEREKGDAVVRKNRADADKFSQKTQSTNVADIRKIQAQSIAYSRRMWEERRNIRLCEEDKYKDSLGCKQIGKGASAPAPAPPPKPAPKADTPKKTSSRPSAQKSFASAEAPPARAVLFRGPPSEQVP